MTATNYRPEIDGLRAIAVIAVILFHARFAVNGEVLLPGGFLGVDIFFVISGYLIGRIVCAELRDGKFSYLKFYERRARRILPGLAAVITATFVCAWLWMTPRQFENMSQSALATILFSSNIFFWLDTNYFSESVNIKPLAHTWSLGVEEQFYLLFPPMMALLVTRKLLPLLTLGVIAAASFYIAYATHQDYPDANFYLLPSRMWELIIGSMIAQREIEKGAPSSNACRGMIATLSLFAILYAFATFDHSLSHPGIGTLLPVVATALLIICGRSGPAYWLLSSRPMVAVGLISYSVYLWHQPVFAFARISSLNSLDQGDYMILTALVVALSIASWRLIELPFRTVQIQRRNVWRITATTSAALATAALISSAAGGYPSRVPHFARIEHEVIMGDKTLSGVDCHTINCVVGAPVTPTIAIVGDSHASIFAHGLDRKLSGSGLAAKFFATGDMLMDSFPSYYDKHELFNKINAETRLALEGDNFRTVILSARYTLRVENTPFDNGEGGFEDLPQTYNGRTKGQKAELLKSIEASILTVLANGKRIVLVYPIPEAGWHVPQTIAKMMMKNVSGVLSTSHQAYKDRHSSIISLFDSIPDNPNLLRIRPDDVFCDTFVADRCATHSNTQIFYVDDDHLSIEGAHLLEEFILKRWKEKWGPLG